ncbi:MAG: trypsin-like peptidase domain-containing protein [Reinekea sp.]|jgi:S1-C subfamily serine protease
MIQVKKVKDWLLPILLGLIIGGVYVLCRWWPVDTNVDRPSLIQNSYKDAIQRALPFNVSIISYQTENTDTIEKIANDPVFSKYFIPNHQPHTTLGSGIIFSQDGWIVTNAHVIQNTEKIVVQTADNQLTSVTQILIDPESDIAVLKTELSSSLPAPIAPPMQEEIGDIVFSLGNPFGIGQSVSMGIISAQRRQQPGLTSINDFIQTDAAINPGNSGGALINGAGEIIGMNTAIFTSSGGSQGIGFAIPFDVVATVAQQLMKQGAIQRGFLGIDVQPVPIPEQLTTNSPTQGLYVTSVRMPSPAEEAGIRAGDIIIELANTPVSSRTEAARLISQLMPGKMLEIALIRDNNIIKLEATLSEKPKHEP